MSKIARVHDKSDMLKAWYIRWRNATKRTARRMGLPIDGKRNGLPAGVPEVPKSNTDALIISDTAVEVMRLRADEFSFCVSAVVNILFDFVSPLQEEQMQTDRGFKDKIDRRGGYGNLGERHRAAGKGVNEVQGGQDHAEGMFRHLAGNRPVRTTPGTQGNPMYIGTDPDDNTITYRARAKRSSTTRAYDGPPTVGVTENGKTLKIRFVK